MSMAVTWHRLRVGPSDMYLIRMASFKDTLFIGMHQGEPHPVFRDRVSDCTFTRCKHPGCFPILHVRKIYFGGHFWCFWCPYYALAVMSNRWNQCNFSTLYRLYIWGHRWILVLLQIFVHWCKHWNTNVVGSKCILKSILVYNWKTKSDFWSWAYIYYSLCPI